MVELSLLVEVGVCLFAVDKHVALAETSLGFGGFVGVVVFRHGVCGGLRGADRCQDAYSGGQVLSPYFSSGALSLFSLVMNSSSLTLSRVNILKMLIGVGEALSSHVRLVSRLVVSLGLLSGVVCVGSHGAGRRQILLLG